MALIRIAAALVLVLALQLSAASPAPADPCTRVCGHLRVPYPFGIGPPDAGCYLPGLNLTCDTSGGLLLSAGADALQVVDIFLHNSTLRVVQAGAVAIGANGRGLFNGVLRDHGPYKLSLYNELVVTGCNVLAMQVDRNSSVVMSACASFCEDPNGPYATAVDMDTGSCKEPVMVTRDEVAGYVQLTRFGQNGTMDEARQLTQVFVAEQGWFDRNRNFSVAGALADGAMSAVPLLLDWEVVDLERGRPPPNEFDKWFGDCPADLARKICRSGNSTCGQSGGYSCSCTEGYDGNPYMNGSEGCHGN